MNDNIEADFSVRISAGQNIACNQARVLAATTVLTSAQILSLKAHPVIIAPAPGIGKLTLPLAGCIQLKFGTTPYVAPTSGFANAWFGPSITVAELATYPDVLAFEGGNGGEFLLGKSSALITSPNDYWGFGVAVPVPDNQPVFYGLPSDASGEYTAGDSTLKITVVYVIVDVT